MNKEPFYLNIEKETITNTNYRKVLYTSSQQQFVLMSLKPLEDIPKEIHKDHDQFIRVEKGTGEAIVNSKTYKLYDGIGIIIPAGSEHQIINTSTNELLKLYTIYSPPEHDDKIIQETKETTKHKYESKYFKYKSKYLNLKNN